MTKALALSAELQHRAAVAARAPLPGPVRPPRPEWAKARGERIGATASSGGSQPTDEHVRPERGSAGKEHNPRTQRHWGRLWEHARHAEHEERDRDREARCRVECNSQKYDHDASSAGSASDNLLCEVN